MNRLRFALTLAVAVLSAFLLLAAAATAKPRTGKPVRKASILVVQAPKAAQLTAGATTKVKVKVLDHGKAPVVGVMLLAKASKGVTVKPAKAKLGRLAPGRKKAATFAVSVAAGVAKPTLGFVATAPGAGKARDKVALQVGPGKSEPPKEEAKKTPEIVGKYFWNSESVLSTTYIHGYYVVDEHWIYRGIPKEGPPACSSQTANGEEDGCLPYTWNESTGALTVGSEGGEYKVGSHLMKVGEKTYEEAVMPEAGTKFDAEGSYINQYGICPSSCSFVTVELKMSSNGEFARAAGVAGFFGEGGSYGALPPEDHGTYSIDPRGKIAFTYADGHVVVETIGVLLDKSDNPDPNYGLLLGASVFFGPHSDV